MKTINLFLIDMNVKNCFSGVDRYMSVLIAGLKKHNNINICRINFCHDANMLFWEETEQDGYKQLTISMPLSPKGVIAEEYWTDRFNENAYRIAEHLFKDKSNILLHLHTLNLIDFALLVKSHYPESKILTHLHCIPWKGYYNNLRSRFNRLYEQVYLGGSPDVQSLLTNHSEMRAYKESDGIVSVTHCAREFLTQQIGITPSKIRVIQNGMPDEANQNKQVKASQEHFQILYVGSIAPSKGLEYILQAMRKLQEKGYKMTLTAAGRGKKEYLATLSAAYSDLDVRYVGNVPFEELKSCYHTCDIGVIASLQEQCSYVAIEMAMFGIPLVSTAVDGLDEMFIQDETALKVATRFSKAYGLTVDVDNLEAQMKRMMDDEQLRIRLSKNIRKSYLEKFGLEDMVDKTVEEYNHLLELR